MKKRYAIVSRQWPMPGSGEWEGSLFSFSPIALARSSGIRYHTL